MDKTKQLEHESIGKLLAKYSIPAIIAMIVNAIYNIVDRMFIGKFAGESALGGLSVTAPLMMIVIAFASLVGAGSASVMAIKLGKDDKKGASKTFGNSITLGIVISAILLAICYPLLSPLLVMLGSSQSLLPFARDYMNIVLIGFGFQMVSFVLSSTVRIEGYPMLSMIPMLVGAVSNIILDYVFIGILGWGVKGAATATVIGQVLGFIVLIMFYLRGKSNLDINRKIFKPDVKEIKDIISVGLTSFLSTIGGSVAAVFLNRALLNYGGDGAITAMGAIGSLTMLFFMPMIGVQQGMQPIIGYNYGCGQKKRVNKTLRLSVLSSSVFAIIVFILLQLFPTSFMSMFISEDSPTMGLAITGLRHCIFLLPVLSISFMGTAYFQSIAKSRQAVTLGALRQFILLLPAVLILPKIFGLKGVWLATPVADAITVVVTAIFLIKDIKSNNIDETEDSSFQIIG